MKESNLRTFQVYQRGMKGRCSLSENTSQVVLQQEQQNNVLIPLISVTFLSHFSFMTDLGDVMNKKDTGFHSFSRFKTCLSHAIDSEREEGVNQPSNNALFDTFKYFFSESQNNFSFLFFLAPLCQLLCQLKSLTLPFDWIA